MRKTILIVDDDERLIQLLSEYLAKFDLQVIGAGLPSVGIKLLRQKNPSLVILDVMLPEKNGFELCTEIRRESQVPVIMLTARGEVTDRVVGLELGADDYLSKPFEPRELLARIQSVLRRGTEGGTVKVKHLDFGSLQIDLVKRSVLLQGSPVELTTMEFEALSLFAQHPGEVLGRDQIMDHLRGIDWEAYNRSIDVLISRLRQKLKDDPKAPTYFKTIRGTGYLFLGEKKVGD
jgi:DNA-binding response OmpR family regulator